MWCCIKISRNSLIWMTLTIAFCIVIGIIFLAVGNAERCEIWNSVGKYNGFTCGICSDNCPSGTGAYDCGTRDHNSCVCVEEGVKLSWECLPCMSLNKRVLTRSVAPGAIALLALGALLFVPGVILGFMWWCYLCAYVEQVKENNPFKKGSPKSTTSDQPAVEEAKSDDQPVSQ